MTVNLINPNLFQFGKSEEDNQVRNKRSKHT